MGIHWKTKAYTNLRHAIDCCGLSWFDVQERYAKACPESVPLVDKINGGDPFTDGQKAELRLILNFEGQSNDWLFSRL